MDFLPALQEGVRNAFCSTFEDAGAFADFAEGLTQTIPGPWGIAAGVGTQLASRYGYNAACPASGGPYPSTETPPPFQGGQCAGTLYFVRLVWQHATQGQLTDQDALPGPIGAAQVDNIAGQWRVRVPYQNTFWEVGGYSAGSAKPVIVSQGFFQPPQGPDNCGDLPGTSSPTNITYDNSTGDEETIETNITFGVPSVNLSGRITVPVRFDGPLVDLGAEIDLSNGEISLNFGGDEDNSGCGLPPQSEPPPVTPESPPQEEPEGQLPIIGVIVEATINDPITASQYYLFDGPTLYLPRLGKVTFAALVSETDSEWMTPIDVQCARSYIACPAYQGATYVIGSPIQGVTFELFEVRASISSIFE